jgi:hypothetical protein
MIRPDVGVITTIGLAHAAGLRDLETTAREKLKLFARLACDVQDRGDKTFDLHDAGHHTGWLVYPGADATLGAMALPGRPLACWVVEDEAAAACRVGAAAFDVVAQARGAAARGGRAQRVQRASGDGGSLDAGCDSGADEGGAVGV